MVAMVVMVSAVQVPVSADLDPLGTSPAPEGAQAVRWRQLASSCPRTNAQHDSSACASTSASRRVPCTTCPGSCGRACGDGRCGHQCVCSDPTASECVREGDGWSDSSSTDASNRGHVATWHRPTCGRRGNDTGDDKHACSGQSRTNGLPCSSGCACAGASTSEHYATCLGCCGRECGGDRGGRRCGENRHTSTEFAHGVGDCTCCGGTDASNHAPSHTWHPSTCDKHDTSTGGSQHGCTCRFRTSEVACSSGCAS